MSFVVVSLVLPQVASNASVFPDSVVRKEFVVALLESLLC